MKEFMCDTCGQTELFSSLRQAEKNWECDCYDSVIFEAEELYGDEEDE